ncbi:MAG: universal stress protein [Anaerolineae bacterium]|nr:universal stress protein [Anaerolineae bacterium]
MLDSHSCILVPLDGSSLAECVLPHAVALARISKSPIVLLRVVEGETARGVSKAVDPLSWQIRKTEAEAYLTEVAARLSDLDSEVEIRTVDGVPAEQIVSHANEIGVGLIIMSSHGRSGLSEWNINSVVQKVLLRVYVPALIIRAYQPQDVGLDALRYKKLLVPLDGSQRAECVLPLASAVAEGHNATLLAAHVIRRPEVPRQNLLSSEKRELVDRLVELNREEATAYLDGLGARLSCAVETRLLDAESPAAALHELTRQESVDLTLLSAHGYSGQAEWPYGSITLNFIAYGVTPLLIMQDLTAEDARPSMAEKVASETKGH